jgi:glycosyltransferase involved in cell wall biosynthesis
MSQTLSLCIPAYNAANYLPRLLKSARSQKIPFDEILVYNDCSTDNTRDVAERYGATVIEGSVNMGCSYGKNKLAEHTSADWIHFHDADDELLPEFTTLAHRWMNKTDCPDVVLFDYEYRDHQTGDLLSIRKFDRRAVENDPVAYAISEQINPFCGLYRKSGFLGAGGYDTDPLVLYNEDCAMHISLALSGLRFSAEPVVSIVNYRIGNSMSGSQPVKCLVAQMEVLKKTFSRLKVQGRLGDYHEVLAEKAWKIAGHLAAENDWKHVRDCIAIANELHSSSPGKGNIIFKRFCTISPLNAFRLREFLISTFKPELRAYRRSE